MKGISCNSNVLSNMPVEQAIDALAALSRPSRHSKKQVVHMHAKDAASDPENIIFPPLGEGEINYDALIGTMAASGFDGYIAVEYEAFA